MNIGNIGVAAICKDEEDLIIPWLRHIDTPAVKVISLVDTGSTDKTVELIKKYNSPKVVLQQVKFEGNFSLVRNISLEPLKDKCKWFCWLDIDTFLAASMEWFLDVLELGKYPVHVYDSIRFRAARFLSRKQTLATPPYEHWGLYKLERVKGFVRELHEKVLINDEAILRPPTRTYHLGHYDLAKIALQNEKGKGSPQFLMGMKKKNYLHIRKATNTLAKDDPDPDTLTREQIEQFGMKKLSQELSVEISNKEEGWLHNPVLSGLLPAEINF